MVGKLNKANHSFDQWSYRFDLDIDASISLALSLLSRKLGIVSDAWRCSLPASFGLLSSGEQVGGKQLGIVLTEKGWSEPKWKLLVAVDDR